MAHKPIEKFGVQVEKARVITVYRNGDKHHDGVQVTMNMKKFKTYDQVRRAALCPAVMQPTHAHRLQLKAEMTKVVKGFTGSIRTVRTPQGRLVKTMDEFVDGGMVRTPRRPCQYACT